MFLVQVALASHLIAVPDTIHLRWKWDVVDQGLEQSNAIALCKHHNVIIGTATSEYQIAGSAQFPDSNWASWEKQVPIQPSSFACNGAQLHEDDIKLLQELGVTAYRFSVDWSWIEPQQGLYDYQVIEHYATLCRKLHEAGIKVMVTLHHFVHPQWFEEAGAFEHEENIIHFVRFCEMVYENLADDVDWWCTINEPGVYVFSGYIRGVFPPGGSLPLLKGLAPSWALPNKKSAANIRLAARVTRNLLQAHMQVYQTLKRLYHDNHIGLNEPSIGLAHQYLTFESFHNPYSMKGLIESNVASIFTSWVHRAIFEALATGNFSFAGAPLQSTTLPDLPDSYDWIGLNYYSHVFIDLDHPDNPAYYDEDIPTDMPYGLYAEGLYRALKDVATRLKKQIYITENGIADRHDTRRDIWIKRSIHAMCVALQEGVDVRGYFYWSLMDNYEWDMGYDQSFGLYAVNFTSSHFTRSLKPGSRYFVDVAQAVRA